MLISTLVCALDNTINRWHCYSNGTTENVAIARTRELIESSRFLWIGSIGRGQKNNRRSSERRLKVGLWLKQAPLSRGLRRLRLG
jgi:hypothetical protein